MSDLTHADLVGAAEKARWAGDLVSADRRADRNGEVEVLLAILRIHTPVVTDDRVCAECVVHRWPCSTVEIVADRLRGWGVL